MNTRIWKRSRCSRASSRVSGKSRTRRSPAWSTATASGWRNSADEGELRRLLHGEVDAPLPADPLDTGGKFGIKREIAAGDQDRLAPARQWDDEPRHTIRAARRCQLAGDAL